MFRTNCRTSPNKAIKFVPALAGLHRTPLSGRRLLLALYDQAPPEGVIDSER